MEGIETEHRLNTWVNFTVPSINPRANSWMYLQTGDTNIVGAGSGALAPAEAIEKLMKMPAFSDWFRKARIVKKVATAMGSTIMSPLMEPYIGNVIIIGDAAALIETTNPGAIACGYKAVTAVLDELKGKNGFAAYAAWWQRAFDTNDPDYLKAAGRNFSINLLCSDEEVNYLYGIVADKVGLPATLVAREMERVKAERPALFEKLNKAGVGVDVAGQKVDLTQVLSGKAGSSK
jgi:flavin-dependent dehydrogenase